LDIIQARSPRQLPAKRIISWKFNQPDLMTIKI